nr:unknown [Ipomoea trifida]
MMEQIITCPVSFAGTSSSLPFSKDMIWATIVYKFGRSDLRVNHVHRRNGLSPGVLRVGHRISNHVFEEDLEDASGLLVDEAGDTLHAASASQTADGGLGDSLDVVAEDLPVTLGSSLAQALTSLSTA